MKRRCAAFVAAIVTIFALATTTAFAADTHTTYGDDLPTTGANDWQIVAQGYQGNASSCKTNVSDDGFVRVQKNVVPSDTENQFKVYLSVDAMSKSVVNFESTNTILSDLDFYKGGTANGFPAPTEGESVEGSTGGFLCDEVKGAEKAVVLKDGAPTFVIEIYHKDADGRVQHVASPVLQTVVPNSVLYIMVGDQYIALENIQEHGHQILIGGTEQQPASDGYYHVPVFLTDMAYEALFNEIINEESEEITVIDADSGALTITDPAGEYIVYDGFVAGDIVADTAPDAATEAGTTQIWTVQAKSHDDVNTTEPEVDVDENEWTEGSTTYYTKTTTTTFWYQNIIELVYNVHLDTALDGFKPDVACDVNGPTSLAYVGVDDSDKSVVFQVPQVKGMLFGSLSITKEVTADRGLTAPDASFSFKVTLGSAYDGATYMVGEAPAAIAFPENGELVVSLKAGETVTVDGIPVGAAYSVTEVAEDMPAGFTNTVTPADASGTIVGTDPISLSFTNNYSVQPTTAEITAHKTLKNADLKSGAFSFEIAGADGGPMPASPTATNDADGNITFGEIEFVQPGKYVYAISEVDGGDSAYEYDDSEKTVTVTVVDNGDGTMTATVEGGGTDADFVNVYKALPDTGDNNAMFWCMVLVVCCGALAVGAFRIRKKA